MTLTKADLTKKLTEETGLNRQDAKLFVDQFFEDVKTLLEAGQPVKLSGFGKFDVRDKRQRPGRNPKTGEDIPITARRVVTFKPGQKLKANVEGLADNPPQPALPVKNSRIYGGNDGMPGENQWCR